MAARRFFASAEKRAQRPRRAPKVRTAVADHAAPAGDLVDQTAQPPQVGTCEPLLDVAGAARFLGLSVKAVYQHVYRNHLPIRRVGRLLKFDQRELEAYTRRHREPESGWAAMRLVRRGR